MFELDANDTPLTLRVKAAQAAVDKYDGRDLVWGECDCIRPAAFVARQLGRKFPLAKAGRYSSLKGAVLAIKRTGFDTLEAAIDDLGFPRIGYASALPGDLLALPGAGSDWVALFIYLGNGRALGFGDRDGREVCGVVKETEALWAWKVDPCPRP
jgi:hypothetical protein